jgi:hypothetical protein
VTSVANCDMGFRSTTMRFTLLLGIIPFILGGCGGGGGSSCGSTVDITGNWSGPVIEDEIARGNPGTIDATITQSGCDLGGGWQFTFQSPTLNRTFLIGGYAPESTNIQFPMQQCLDANCFSGLLCVYNVTATLVSPTEMTGSYATESNCSATDTGSFSLTLQSRLAPTPVDTAVPTPSPTP